MTPTDATFITGQRAEDGRALAWIDGDFPLPHVVHHSPTGFEWSYGGSGPADLALSILSYVIGDEQETVEIFDGGRVGCLAWLLHQQFKWDFVATWPREGGWAISVGEVRRWIARQPAAQPARDHDEDQEHFSQAEAQAKVGKRIRTRVDFSGVPAGTTGRVVSADPAGQAKAPFGEAVETFDVAIQWDLPRPTPSADLVIPAKGEPYIEIRNGKPLVDWFTKGEYEQYLDELGEQH